MPTRSVAPRDDIIATLTFSGVGDTGAFVGDERSVTGFSVTNNAVHNGRPVVVSVRVEEEFDKQRVFTATIQPGQTIANSNLPVGQRPRQTWAQIGSIAMWDGLNIYWRIPA